MYKKIAKAYSNPLIKALLAKARAPLRICPSVRLSVRLSVCLSVAKMRTKCDFLKSKQFRATVFIDVAHELFK